MICTGCSGPIDAFNTGLDNLLLLDNKASFYIRYLEDDLAVQRCISRRVDDYPYYSNYFVSAPVSRTSKSDFGITCWKNGSFTFHGKNSTDNYSYKTFYEGCLLPPGTYRLYLKQNKDPKDFKVYLEGWKTQEDGMTRKTMLASSDGDQFTIEDADEYDQYYIGIAVGAGYEDDDMYFFPQLIPSDVSPDDNQPVSIAQNWLGDSDTFYNFRTISITKKQLSESTCKDWKIFLTALRYQVKSESVDWYSVIFNDGTAIEFENGDASKGKYGKADPIGRVTSVTGYLYDAGNYMTLTNENGTCLNGETSDRGINGIE